MRIRQDEVPPVEPHDDALPHMAAAADVQTNLARVIRNARLPQVHRRVMTDSNVFIDRSIYAVLFAIDRLGEATMGDLAGELLRDVSTISRQVRQLVDAGLATRVGHPEDRRKALVTTTPEGHDVTARITRAWHSAFADALDDWTAADLLNLADRLARLAGSLRESGDEIPDAQDSAGTTEPHSSSK